MSASSPVAFAFAWLRECWRWAFLPSDLGARLQGAPLDLVGRARLFVERAFNEQI